MSRVRLPYDRRAMVGSLEEIFRQNVWANGRLIEVCAALTDEQLDSAPAGGTYGSIRSTLMHLVGAQDRYVDLMSGIEPRESVEEKDFPGWEELKGHAEKSGEELVSIAATKNPGDSLRRPFGPQELEMDASVVLVQAINHATEHRTQIKTILTELGIVPPELDGWTYGAFNGLVRTVED